MIRHDNSSERRGYTRRSFVKGCAVAGLGAAATGLAACAPAASGSDGDAGRATDGAESEQKSFDIVETKECDVCVVGAGASGLAAAVQAAQDGARVLCLESQKIAGGNINGVEGCFGIGSSMQKERGIDIDPGATIRSELAASQMRASGPGYVDMVHNSGENIDWLVENGVAFGGVDVDKGTLEVFHRFASGRGQADYAEPMAAKAEELGVEFVFETAAHTLIKGGTDAIEGLYADSPDGTIQVNAKAVIVATGGFAQNDELLAGVALNKHLTYGGFEGHDGSGHLMCVDAGAHSYRDRTSLLVAFDIEGTPGYYDGGLFAFVLGVAAPYAVWVNQNGERYANEDCAGENAMLMCMPALAQEDAFCVLDSAMMDQYGNGNSELYDQIDRGIEHGSIFKADTIESLAQAAGLPADTFAATIGEYNGFAADGSDRNYGKAPATLMPVQQAPFYALRISSGLNSTIGSIYTDRSFHALDGDMQPIDGLYVVGTEGAMLWSNLYTINVSGGCNANNVNSGRTAAKDAVAKL